MHSEDFLIDDGSNWQAIEAIRKSLPKLDIIPTFALVVETINTIDRSAFVVTSENEEIFRVLDLVCQKQADCF
jgi:hypothetical protein